MLKVRVTVFVILLLGVMLTNCKSTASKEEGKPNINFQIIKENITLGNDPRLRAYFYVDKTHYNRESLMKLFAWYSSTKAIETGQIIATACDDRGMAQKDLQVNEWWERYGYYSKVPADIMEGWRGCKATLYRDFNNMEKTKITNGDFIF